VSVPKKPIPTRWRVVDDRASPSAGWQEVYDAMAADADIEDPTRACPDCGRRSKHLLRDVSEGEAHGGFRASATGRDTGNAEDAGSVEGTTDRERDAPDEGADPATRRVD